MRLNWLAAAKILVIAANVAIYAFIGSVFYSMFYVKIMPGEAAISLKDSFVIMELPLTVANEGFYSLTGLNFRIKIEGPGGIPVLTNSTQAPIIKAGGSWRGRLALIVEEETMKELTEKGYKLSISFALKYAEPMISINSTQTMRIGPA